MRGTLEERFWAKVDKRGIFDCWPWMASTGNDGYGHIGEGGRSRKLLAAHRVAYELVNGPIPDGQCVLHECDNPPCCNPTHLFLGTQTENIHDMREKGRECCGEEHGASKLTRLQVEEARRLYTPWSRSHGYPALARRYGVGYSTIRIAIQGGTWK